MPSYTPGENNIVDTVSKLPVIESGVRGWLKNAFLPFFDTVSPFIDPIINLIGNAKATPINIIIAISMLGGAGTTAYGAQQIIDRGDEKPPVQIPTLQPTYTIYPTYTFYPTVSPHPAFQILDQETGRSVTIKARNFPVHDTLEVFMSLRKNCCSGGYLVTTLDSGINQTYSHNDSTFTISYNIPAQLKGKSEIAIWFISPVSGLIAFNSFSDTEIPGTGRTPAPVVKRTLTPTSLNQPTVTLTASTRPSITPEVRTTRVSPAHTNSSQLHTITININGLDYQVNVDGIQFTFLGVLLFVSSSMIQLIRSLARKK